MGTDQDETGYQRQFNAAVSVIQSLPKHGAYRPSYEEMLRFYGYYKQATVGPCNISRPAFWDPIGKYKWDAWNKLGAMSQEDAMCAYIREMKRIAQKIIDTIPLEDKTPDMFEPFRPLYDVIPDMPRPPDAFFKTIEQESCEDTKKVIPEGDDMDEQQSSDPILYEAISGQTELGAISEQEELKQRSESLGETTRPLQSEQKLQSWGSENEYCDSVEQLGSDQECEENGSKIYPHLFQASDTHKQTKIRPRRKSADRQKDENIGPANEVWLRSPSEEGSGDTSTGSQTRFQSAQYQLSPQIKATVEALQATVQGLRQRVENLETALQEQRRYTQEQTQRSHKKPRRPVLAKSRTLLFIVIWPFVAHWLLRRVLWRKR